MELKNKVCIITGASRGFGKELALLLGEKECNLVLAAREENEQKGMRIYYRCELESCNQFDTFGLSIHAEEKLVIPKMVNKPENCAACQKQRQPFLFFIISK